MHQVCLSSLGNKSNAELLLTCWHILLPLCLLYWFSPHFFFFFFGNYSSTTGFSLHSSFKLSRLNIQAWTRTTSFTTHRGRQERQPWHTWLIQSPWWISSNLPTWQNVLRSLLNHIPSKICYIYQISWFWVRSQTICHKIYANSGSAQLYLNDKGFFCNIALHHHAHET